MAYAQILFALLLSSVNAGDIELLECEPPDLPRYGGYGPRQDFYIPGDVVHYYCDADTFIGGNFYRRCEDSGDWSGDTPVCDSPTSFSSVSQTSILNAESSADRATDGIRTTCTSTVTGQKGEWSGTFTKPGQLIRVMLFLPKGSVSYEVVLLRPNGEERVCGSSTTNIERYEWTIHNCPEPHNTGATGVKIRSLNTAPLQICELQAHVLTSPKCVDPHVQIESGRLRLDRKTAILECNYGFTRSPDDRLQCIREGVWNRKPLYCIERQWELDPNSNTDTDPRSGNPNNNRQQI